MYKERVSGYPGWICFAVIPLAILTFILVTLVLQGLRALTYSTFSWLGLEGAGVALLGATLLIFTLILFPLALLTMPALGLLWAPFAALVCSRAARARGLETRRYALAGAIYSILFFWPWVYLILRMYNKHIPGCIIRIVYILTYGVLWPISTLSLLLLAIWYQQPFRSMLIFVLLLNILAWFVSLIMLIVWRRRQGRVLSDESDDVLPNRVYIMPFAYVLGWLLIAMPLWRWVP